MVPEVPLDDDVLAFAIAVDPLPIAPELGIVAGQEIVGEGAFQLTSELLLGSEED